MAPGDDEPEIWAVEDGPNGMFARSARGTRTKHSAEEKIRIRDYKLNEADAAVLLAQRSPGSLGVRHG